MNVLEYLGLWFIVMVIIFVVFVIPVNHEEDNTLLYAQEVICHSDAIIQDGDVYCIVYGESPTIEYAGELVIPDSIRMRKYGDGWKVIPGEVN